MTTNHQDRLKELRARIDVRNVEAKQGLARIQLIETERGTIRRRRGQLAADNKADRREVHWIKHRLSQEVEETP